MTEDGNGSPLTQGMNEAWVSSTALAAENTRALRMELDLADRAGRRFAGSLLTAFEGLAFRGKGLSDVMRSLALSMSQVVLKAAFAPIQQSIGGLFSGVLKGGLGFSRGGVLSGGGIVPFAQGGVISSPIAFPLSGGMTGVAGERGAEAIMPLSRGSDGRLGVVARTGGAATINIHIATPDVEGFRKSQSQIAAMIARTAALGQRNL